MIRGAVQAHDDIQNTMLQHIVYKFLCYYYKIESGMCMLFLYAVTIRGNLDRIV